MIGLLEKYKLKKLKSAIKSAEDVFLRVLEINATSLMYDGVPGNYNSIELVRPPEFKNILADKTSAKEKNDIDELIQNIDTRFMKKLSLVGICVFVYMKRYIKRLESEDVKDRNSYLKAIDAKSLIALMKSESKLIYKSLCASTFISSLQAGNITYINSKFSEDECRAYFNALANLRGQKEKMREAEKEYSNRNYFLAMLEELLEKSKSCNGEDVLKLIKERMRIEDGWWVRDDFENTLKQTIAVVEKIMLLELPMGNEIKKRKSI
jgi:hypothetical protein